MVARLVELNEPRWASSTISAAELKDESPDPIEPIVLRTDLALAWPESLQSMGRAMHDWILLSLGEVRNSRLSLGLGEEQPLPSASQLIQLLRVEPIEDGISHPADAALNGSKEPITERWLAAAFSRVEQDSKAKAALLRCLARVQRDRVDDAISSILEAALEDDQVELREAAVRAVEQWEDSTFAHILRSHQEREPWLREYVAGVLADLQQV